MVAGRAQARHRLAVALAEQFAQELGEPNSREVARVVTQRWADLVGAATSLVQESTDQDREFDCAAESIGRIRRLELSGIARCAVQIRDDYGLDIEPILVFMSMFMANLTDSLTGNGGAGT